MAKKAKTSMGDEPSASTVGAPETVVISPEPSPQCTLQPSPQHEPTTHFLLASVGENIFTTDITGLVGEERQQGEPLEAVPDVPPPSTTPPRDEPSAGGSGGEPICVEEEPTSIGVGHPTSATDVAGKGEANSQQLDTGKPHALALAILSLFLSS